MENDHNDFKNACDLDTGIQCYYQRLKTIKLFLTYIN